MILPNNLLLHTDGGCMPKNPGGISVSAWVFYDANDTSNPIHQEGCVVREGGDLSTNNYAEYMAFLLALQQLADWNWRGTLTAKLDSKLIVDQIVGNWNVQAAHLNTIREQIFDLFKELKIHIPTMDNLFAPQNFTDLNMMWIPRKQNSVADQLCKDTYSKFIGKDV